MSTEATAWGDCPNCNHDIRPGDFIHEADGGWWEHDNCDDNEREWRTTDTALNARPVEKVIRDELAHRIHEMEHGPEHNFDDPTCWAAWEPEADALMPIVLKWLALAWEEGSRNGARGVLPDAVRVRRNPYRGGWKP